MSNELHKGIADKLREIALDFNATAKEAISMGLQVKAVVEHNDAMIYEMLNGSRVCVGPQSMELQVKVQRIETL